jgi:hypothetical protein
MRNSVDDDECEEMPRQAETSTVNCGVLVVELENIEEMRRRRGITDDKLRDEIRALAVGDQVRLTLATGAETFSGKTLHVRITTIKGQSFQGELTKKPSSARGSKLRVGSRVTFTAAHIHSVDSPNSA